MVTSNKVPDKKVVKMAEQKNCVVVPQRTLLGEVNEHITCPLCSGYYIDATTIVECLHSFCRSCIIKHLQVKSYCPVCEMMINSAKPNIKLDKALQDIVYKLVPGLFQREMERRQQFYASRPGPAATATPEQRGEDTERIIFSPEDVISFSLEYADMTDADSISSKSSDSNEPQTAATTRRYLQCPAVVNISHLKKFLSMKFDIDSTQFAIDILYKRVPLPDYYTLMDIAYIYNWKRNEPMRFFYQIIDYVAIRNRLFDINRKESHFGDRKSSPTSTEDTNASSPAPNLNDNGSEASSGTDSPMPDDNNTKKVSDTSKSNTDKTNTQNKEQNVQSKDNVSTNKSDGDTHTSLKKNDEDEQKSQFLNSFELTAKNSSTNLKSSPVKSNTTQDLPVNEPAALSKNSSSPKTDDNLKRKYQAPPSTPEMKKLRVEIEKAKITTPNTANIHVSQSNQSIKSIETPLKSKSVEGSSKNCASPPVSNSLSSTSVPVKDDKKESKQTFPMIKPTTASESMGIKRNVTGSQNSTSSPKRKPPSDNIATTQSPSTVQKTVSPLKIQLPRSDSIPTGNKVTEVPTTPTATVKKMPDLKPSSMGSAAFSNKQPVNKVRMDLLANNSDIDRSKILPPVKSPINAPTALPNSGDPLKSLFDSCKINIPSSLSITLTDQKLEARNPNEQVNVEQKKNVVNKALAGAASNATTAHKVPSPPVHNYIQILKLPDADMSKKSNKSENNSDIKLNASSKTEGSSTPSKVPNKSTETSAKGPVPNLKPIADTKLAKQSGNFSAPITFQQTFEQQLQSMQSDKKSKLPKNKPQVPKLVPATPKALSAVNKPNNPNSKPNVPVAETKTSSALDLSTTHSIQSQMGPQQTYEKNLETMQSIANLAKRQNLPSKGLSMPMSQSNVFPGISNRPMTSGGSQIRIPSTGNINQIKPDKVIASSPHRQEVPSKNNTLKSATSVSSTVPSPSYPITSHSSPSNTQPSPRSQTRSPSSSPKLVIAEEKQVSNSTTDQTVSQSNQMMNMQALSNMGLKNESSKTVPGPSKSGLKPVKSLTPTGKMPLIRQPHAPTMKPSPMLNAPDYQALLRHQFEMNNWFKVHQRHYDIYKNTLTQQTQNDFGNKEKQ